MGTSCIVSYCCLSFPGSGFLLQLQREARIDAGKQLEEEKRKEKKSAALQLSSELN